MRLTAKAAPALLGVFLVLAGCETAEERAEGHYQRGLALIAEGEPARAEVELRNVFRLDGDHTEARLAYAGLLEDRGDAPGALSQYLRLVEQDPGSLEGRRAVARLALALEMSRPPRPTSTRPWPPIRPTPRSARSRPRRNTRATAATGPPPSRWPARSSPTIPTRSRPT